MADDKPHINIVWFKRDLRLEDNEAISNAVQQGKPTLLLYIFEESLLNDPHYSERHWNFVKESLVDLNKQLASHNTRILTVTSEVIQTFGILQQFWNIDSVFSHQETGLRITYERDKSFGRFCKNNMIKWVENINNSVTRGQKDRKTWRDDFANYINQPLAIFPRNYQNFIPLEKIEEVASIFTQPELATPTETAFQKGGPTMAWKYMRSFFKDRYQNYRLYLSKPLQSRKGCSRLSPYLAWGNLSVRQVFTYAAKIHPIATHKEQIDAFLSRLQWQAFYIQKFEMEHLMETESLNAGFHKLKKSISKEYHEAWIAGKTGYPLVDACMRCLKETGYLNFRMRALVASFYVHYLWQPWQAASAYLSQCFLDFEPGIHFPQLQDQAGETGTKVLRVYNPIKNSMEHDPDGVFIKEWVLELREVPTKYIHEPYKMPSLEQHFIPFFPGKDYPLPIVPQDVSRKRATDTLWKLQQDPLVQQENERIMKKHALSKKEK